MWRTRPSEARLAVGYDGGVANFGVMTAPLQQQQGVLFHLAEELVEVAVLSCEGVGLSCCYHGRTTYCPNR